MPDLNSAELMAYENWKMDQITRRAPGMSEGALSKWLGHCFPLSERDDNQYFSKRQPSIIA
jgi:hypothetical protein